MALTDVRLLLVDDDPSAIRTMSRMLAQYPDQRFATSGVEALRMAREAPPDLILLDADMPGMTGFDVCAALKADPVLSRVPVIFATGHDDAAIEVAALERGAVDFISKPLVPTQLVARVRAHLRQHRQIDDKDTSPSAGPLVGGRAPRLLIVDDDVIAVRMLRSTLSEFGDFHFATSGESALSVARRLAPDLILLDAHMPGMDGLAVCRALKEESAFRHVPIVFVTRFADPRTEKAALDEGAADFIAKPYMPAVLKARVRNLIELKRRTDVELLQVRAEGQALGAARVADIVGAVPEAILSFDALGQVVLANPAAGRLFGVAPAALVGRQALPLLGSAAGPVQAGERGPLRATVGPAGGDESIAVEVTVSVVGEGAEHLTTVLLRDIRQREQLEAESRARLAAESASQTKSQMLSYFAHEIGNPLNGMSGFAQLMQADRVHPLPPAQATRLGHILSSAQQLERLLREVLEFGRHENAALTMTLGSVDLRQAAQQALTAVSAQAAQADVQLMLGDTGPAVLFAHADAARLHQALVNLLGNAIKYGQRGGQARIELNAAHERGGPALDVIDDGPGLTAAQLQHLFEPFNRLGRGSETPGTGLGLLITRKLVESMAGILLVRSGPEAGCRFTLVLPAQAGGAIAMAPNPNPAPAP